MSTRSITSGVHLKGKRQVRAFLNAIEKSKAHSGETVDMKGRVKTVSDEELREIAPLLRAR